MSTRHLARIALAFALLATTPIPRVVAAERMQVAQTAAGEDDWRRRQKRPRAERPDQPRRPDRGQPVILLAPAIVYGLGNAGGFGGREVAPPKDPERPAARKAKPRAQASKPAKPAKSTRSTARKPPERSTRPVAVAAAGPHVAGEILFTTASPEATETILKRHRLTRLETVDLDLTGTTIVRARIAKGGSSERTLRALRSEKTILSSELNHLFALQAEPEGTGKGDLASVQYAPAKLRLPEAHAVAEGQSVLVAVIDSGIDGSHPELAGTLDPASPARTIGPHGTAIAGVIAAHQRLVSAAPKVRLLAFDSFLAPEGSPARGSTLDILKSLDRAASAGARIVNLSFAGPEDTLLAAGLAAAHGRGIVLVAAAG
jgi:hypothetical protein